MRSFSWRFLTTGTASSRRSRGFSGTELSTGAFKTSALEKGYAFAASDEGWNRLTIAREPDDTYYESRQRIKELTLYAKEMLKAHYKKAPSRTLMMGGSNGGHHTKWMVESYPDLPNDHFNRRSRPPRMPTTRRRVHPPGHPSSPRLSVAFPFAHRHGQSVVQEPNRGPRFTEVGER